MIVHQVLSGAGRFDAVTNEALAFRECFDRWGWSGADVAAHIDQRFAVPVAPLSELRPSRGDLLLIHYSAFAAGVERVLSLPGRKLLLNHNVTPSTFLWPHDRNAALQCALGRQELPRFVAACDHFAADSEYNAQELRDAGADHVDVLPVLFDPSRLGVPGGEPDGPPVLLFVGRLMPHKRQDELIRLLAHYRATHAADATLTLVGAPLNEAYGARLRELAGDGVRFEQGLSPSELADRYRAAHVFVCRSEHEGFCIPIVEAMHFGVPVVARPAGAIPDVAGDAALLSDDHLGVATELVHLALTDAELRAELRRRGFERARAFAPERTEAKLRELVQKSHTSAWEDTSVPGSSGSSR